MRCLVEYGVKVPEGGLTDFDWFAAQIFTIELEQIENAEGDGVIVPAIADHVEYGEAMSVASNRLAVDDARTRWEGSYCRGSEDKSVGQIEALTRKETHAGGVAPSDDAEAIVLDLVNPAWTRRRHFARSRKAWLVAGQGLFSADPAL